MPEPQPSEPDPITTMPIELSEPHVVPAAEAKTFLHGWLHSLNVQTPKPGEGTLVLAIVPHNADTGETLSAPMTHYTASLWEIMAAVPAAGVAMQSVLAAVPDIIAYLQSKEE